LEAQVIFEVHGDFSDEPEKRRSGNQEVGSLLIPSDISQGNRSRKVAMRTFGATSGRTYPAELSPASEACCNFTGVNGWAADQANARCFPSHSLSSVCFVLAIDMLCFSVLTKVDRSCDDDGATMTTMGGGRLDSGKMVGLIVGYIGEATRLPPPPPP